MQSIREIRVVADSGAQHVRARPPVVPATAAGGRGPYRAYRPRPFTLEERAAVTVLFGGLHWRAERLIQGAMENLGYRTRVLPTA